MRLIKKNNRGYSLVEVLVALAILSIVFIAVGRFMVTGVRLFSNINAETNLQNEAQTALNQIENRVIDAGLGVNYAVKADGVYVYAKTDSEQNGKNLTDKILTVFNYNTEYQLVDALLVGYSESENKLYYREYTGANGLAQADPDAADEADRVDLDILSWVSSSEVNNWADWSLFAENVKAFSVDLTTTESDHRVVINLELFKSTDKTNTYSTTGIITLRNNVAVNAEKISTIYERVSYTVVTEVDRVELNVANTTVKGQSYSMTTKVIAKTGYPSQDIYKWAVVGYGDSAVAVDSGTTIDDTTKTLTISENEPNTKVQVFAYVLSGRSADSDPGAKSESNPNGLRDNEVWESSSKYILVYASQIVNIKTIGGFVLQPNKNKSTINEAYNNTYDVMRYGAANNDIALNVASGNTIVMDAMITGDNSLVEEDGDLDIVWAIDEVSKAGVEASITQNGVVSVSKYSTDGSFVIVAYPRLAPNMELRYKVYVNNEAIRDQALTIEGVDTIDRGDSQNLKLKLNGIDVPANELSQFNWSVNVSNAQSSSVSNAVTISSNGVVSVSKSLAFEYSYKITVTASLKNDSTKVATKEITVPRVTVSVTPATVFSLRGNVVTYGTIKAVVTGIKDYSLNWTMATATNPNAYATSTTNGSFVSQSANQKDTVYVSISSNEPKDLSYVRVKATIDGYSNYYGTSRIVLQQAGFDWDGTQPSIISRGDTKEFKVKATGTNVSQYYNINDVEWIIDSVKEGTTDITDTYTGITFEDGKLTVASDYHFTNSDIIVTVHAEWSGLSTKTTTVKISSVELQWATTPAPAASITRGDDATYAVKMRGSTTNLDSAKVQWKVVSGTNDGTALTSIELNKASISNGKVSIASDFKPSLKDTTITISASYGGLTITRDITVPAVKFSWLSTCPDTVERGNNGVFKVKSTDNDSSVITDGLTYTIVGATKNGASTTTTGLSIDNTGTFTVQSDYNPTTDDIQVEIKCTWTTMGASFNINKFVKVPGLSFEVTQDATVAYRGGTGVQFTANQTDVTYSILSATLNGTDIGSARNEITINNGKLQVANNFLATDSDVTVTVRAQWNRYNDFYKDFTVTIPKLVVIFDNTSATVNRGQTSNLTAKVYQVSGASQVLYTSSDITYSISNTNELPATTGLTISGSTLSVSNDYYYSSRDITVKVNATWNGIVSTQTKNVKINKIGNLLLSGSDSVTPINRGDTKTTTATTSAGTLDSSTITWKCYLNDEDITSGYGTNAEEGIRFSVSNGIATVKVGNFFDTTNATNNMIKVVASIVRDGQTITSTKTFKVSQISGFAITCTKNANNTSSGCSINSGIQNGPQVSSAVAKANWYTSTSNGTATSYTDVSVSPSYGATTTVSYNYSTSPKDIYVTAKLVYEYNSRKYEFELTDKEYIQVLDTTKPLSVFTNQADLINNVSSKDANDWSSGRFSARSNGNNHVFICEGYKYKVINDELGGKTVYYYIPNGAYLYNKDSSARKNKNIDWGDASEFDSLEGKFYAYKLEKWYVYNGSEWVLVSDFVYPNLTGLSAVYGSGVQAQPIPGLRKY